MPPVTPQMLDARKEENCVAITTERKYYRVGQTWVKRCLRPSEWQIHPFRGTLIVPRLSKERVWNEAKMLEFIAQNTNIPVPKLYCSFEDDEAVYLVMEYIEGVGLNELGAKDQDVVKEELRNYMETMKKITSKNWGGPSGIVIPPYRVLAKPGPFAWKMRPQETEDLVLCHNDLSANNIIVDSVTLRIKAILDWEYGGFFPPEFERDFYLRPGPSIALEGEEDDADKILGTMRASLIL